MAEHWETLSVNRSAAKQAIGIPNFQHEQWLTLSLMDTATLNESSLTQSAQNNLKHQYRRLAYLGDALMDAVLADYLCSQYPSLSQQNMDDVRQSLVNRRTLGQFAIQLGWPNYCTSRNRKNRRPPEKEPGTYGEMFEALIAAIYIEFDRDFSRIYDWLVDGFVRSPVQQLIRTQLSQSHLE